MLLEEAILCLLRATGYSTVERAGTDPTLHDGPAGLEVRGRGGEHQIDAVADFRVILAFTYPQRLLLEAKCYADDYPVGLAIVRNAVGVVKDSSEYWVPTADGSAAKGRYHYQYALFSASGYTVEAERYAFAQDIYLIPLARSSNVRPIIHSIRGIAHGDFGAPAWNAVQVDMGALRRAIRRRIKGEPENTLPSIVGGPARAKLEAFIQVCRDIGGALLAMLARRFPVFLVPEPGVSLHQIPEIQVVRIFWDAQGWYLNNQQDQRLFSFDLPPDLFEMYAEHGVLTDSRALDLKAETLTEFQAVHATAQGQGVRVITFRLDMAWLTGVRENLRNLPRKHEARETQREGD